MDNGLISGLQRMRMAGAFDAANAFQAADISPSPPVHRQRLTYFQLARLGIAGQFDDDRLLADFGALNHLFS